MSDTIARTIIVPSVGIRLDPLAVFAILRYFLLSPSAPGALIARRTDSTQGMRAPMNILLIPLWLPSGAVVPLFGAAAHVAREGNWS